jgi:hypothetical protein
MLATASYDGKINIWNTDNETLTRSLQYVDSNKVKKFHFEEEDEKT